jgi:hypothetical protein
MGSAHPMYWSTDGEWWASNSKSTNDFFWCWHVCSQPCWHVAGKTCSLFHMEEHETKLLPPYMEDRELKLMLGILAERSKLAPIKFDSMRCDWCSIRKPIPWLRTPLYPIDDKISLTSTSFYLATILSTLGQRKIAIFQWIRKAPVRHWSTIECISIKHHVNHPGPVLVS